ncbi:MAG TPA: hypothetical protein PLK19_17130, partial [Mycobacterium sp.]|nr:hypothetical protein [Mycobacterium sp.]
TVNPSAKAYTGSNPVPATLFSQIMGYFRAGRVRLVDSMLAVDIVMVPYAASAVPSTSWR